MATLSYEQLIQEGIKGLPPEALAEITHFVFFVRKRMLQPDAFDSDLFATILYSDLSQINRESERHLEEEFAEYDQRYPRK